MLLVRTYITRKKGASLPCSPQPRLQTCLCNRCVWWQLRFLLSWLCCFHLPSHSPSSSLSFLINLHDLISLLMKDGPWDICFPTFTVLFLELVGEAGDIHSSSQPNECGNSKTNFRVSEIISVDPWKANLKLKIKSQQPLPHSPIYLAWIVVTCIISLKNRLTWFFSATSTHTAICPPQEH